MRKTILAVIGALTLLTGGVFVANTASAGSGPAVLCAKDGARDLKVFDNACPTGFFKATLPANAVVAGTAGTGVGGAKGDTGPQGPAGKDGKDGTACPTGYTGRAVLLATTTTASDTDQAAWVQASTDYANAYAKYLAADANLKAATTGQADATTAYNNAKAPGSSKTAAEIAAAKAVLDAAVDALKAATAAATAAPKPSSTEQDKAKAAALAASGLIKTWACVAA